MSECSCRNCQYQFVCRSHIGQSDGLAEICSTYQHRIDRDALLELLRMFEADASLAPFQSEEDAAHETLYTRANVVSHIRRMRKALGVEDD